MMPKRTDSLKRTTKKADSSHGHMTGSSLLINEAPLVVLPTLAKVVGLNESIILQQIHYWVRHMEKDSVFIALHEWRRQLPFMSESTIRRALKGLQGMGLVIVENHNKKRYDQTNWYRIDYDALAKLMESHVVKLTSSICSNCSDGSGQDEQTYTRDYKEITKDNTQGSSTFPEDYENEAAPNDPQTVGVCAFEGLNASKSFDASLVSGRKAIGTPAPQNASRRSESNPMEDRPLTGVEADEIERIIADKKMKGTLHNETGLRIHLEREARAGRLRMDGYAGEPRVSRRREEYDFTGIA